MVRLCMTMGMVAAIRYCEVNDVEGWPFEMVGEDPSLEEPKVGNPISHGQAIEVSAVLRKHFSASKNIDQLVYELADLLRGSQVYIAAPNPKPEQTDEYKALMARLRKEEEARVYERMLNRPIPSPQDLRGGVQPTMTGSIDGLEDEELTYADVNRQVAAIFNVLLSIVACSVAIWMAARHWSTASRLGLSMGGGGLVGVAEIVIYAGYLRRILQSKQTERKKVETKVIVDTWSTQDKIQDSTPVPSTADNQNQEHGVRRRIRPVTD